jgi:D-alanyl-D-alanine carboxypeptidase (penicillin-binding protein 5/6)
MNILASVGLVFSLIFVNTFGAKNSLKPSQPSSSSEATKLVTYQPAPLASTGRVFDAEASSAMVYDLSSGSVIYEKSADTQRPIASINKLMTALVIMESHKPNEVVVIKDLPELGPYDQKIDIKNGEEFELSELLKATLIHSANDAANALAIYDSGSIEEFAKKMNQKSQEWGLKNSKYSNANGLEGGDDYSSARDVVTLASLLIQNKYFGDIVSTKSQYISNLAGKEYLLTTTNKILGQGGVIGMKTGYTLKAGQCLVTLAERGGNQIITVVLDSPDRFQESKSMIDWAFNNYIWQ